MIEWYAVYFPRLGSWWGVKTEDGILEEIISNHRNLRYPYPEVRRRIEDKDTIDISTEEADLILGQIGSNTRMAKSVTVKKVNI